MTFILSLKTKQGLVLAADSKETMSGGYLLYEDFAKLLKKKNQTDESKSLCISPNEIGLLINKRARKTRGRIRSISGAQKIFQLTKYAAILIAGTANPGNQEFAITINQIKNKLIAGEDSSFDDVVSAAKEDLNELLANHVGDHHDSEYLICGYDTLSGQFRVSKLFFNKTYKWENGRVKKDEKGNEIFEWQFLRGNLDQPLTTAGDTKCLRELGMFNNSKPNITLEQAFSLSKQVMNLAVLIEDILSPIPGIGGHINYAIITIDGFKWVSESENIRNQISNKQILIDIKNNNKQYVWYASYGSNILEERFQCYIQGGTPEGSTKEYPGCIDKTLPIDNEEFYISSELYFAQKSSAWDDGGMAFIDAKFDNTQQTLGRIYMITKDQFVDVVKQETNHEGELVIDFERAIKEQAYTFKPTSFYGHIIYLGEQYGSPVFTFTHQRNYDPTKPSGNYLKTIARGLEEVFPNISKQEIVEYFVTKKGVVGNYTQPEIKSIVADE